MAPFADILLPTIVSRCQIISLASKDQLELAGEKLKSTEDLIWQILNQGIGERLLTIQPFAKSREEAVQFCQEALVTTHQLLQKNLGNPGKRQKLAKVAASLQKNLQLLEKNINVKLVLENMVLDW